MAYSEPRGLGVGSLERRGVGVCSWVRIPWDPEEERRPMGDFQGNFDDER